MERPPATVQEETPSIQEGVPFVFVQHPELASIGTEADYSKYLETIFPLSKVRNIVYHETNAQFDRFDKEKVGSAMDEGTVGNGFYFTEQNRRESSRSKHTVSAVLDSRNPYYDLKYNIFDFGERVAEGDRWTDRMIVDTRFVNRDDPFVKAVLEKLGDRKEITNKEMAVIFSGAMKDLGYDYSKHNSNLFGGEEVVVFEPDQVHILGSAQDVESFKAFTARSKR